MNDVNKGVSMKKMAELCSSNRLLVKSKIKAGPPLIIRRDD